MSGILSAFIGRVAGVVTDAYFNLVTLLLPGNGTNGAQNNTFLDSSSNNFTITRNGGNPGMTQGTFSPFSQTGWSNFFNGSTDYISVADNAAFTLGSGDFTIEFWVYSTTAGTRQFFAGQMNSAGANISVSFSIEKTSGNKLLGAINSGTTQYAATSSGDIPLNAWTHIALVRDGNTLRQYINGVQDGTVSVTGVTANDSSSQLAIGRLGEFTSNYYFGYISNFRFVKGTCLYTGGTTFTPPTSPLTNITNTSLLTCQSNRFIDNSTNAFTITVNGNTSVQAFSPFAPTAAYSAATVGGSGYFDGTGDYLTAAQNAAFSLGTGAFSVEAFFYLTSFSLTNRIIGLGDGAYGIAPLTYTGWTLNVSSTQVQWYRFDGSETTYNATTTVNLNSWNHVVVCRDSSSNLAIFLNGNRILNQASVTTSYNNVNTNPLYLGRVDDGAGGGSITTKYINGYVSSARVVKGSSVYDPTQTTLTVPTAPLTNITNTSLLLNFTNAGITDATAKNDLETVGNAQISTTQSKFGGSSLYFDGTGDYLIAPDNPIWNLGTSDFTIECWLYLNAINRVNGIWTNGPASSGSFGFYVTSGNKLEGAYFGGATVTGTTSLAANTWYHVAISRSGTTTRIFLNGTQDATNTSSNNNTTQKCTVGNSFTNQTDSPNCYIDDFRITKGYARYTANFTPPTAAFPTQ